MLYHAEYMESYMDAIEIEVRNCAGSKSMTSLMMCSADLHSMHMIYIYTRWLNLMSS